jgi:hypothetical protein
MQLRSNPFSSKQQTSIHNLDKCNGGHLHVSDETFSEAAPKTHKSAGKGSRFKSSNVALLIITSLPLDMLILMCLVLIQRTMMIDPNLHL